MRAMQLEAARAPLRPSDLPLPAPRAGEVLIKIAACGVCR